MVRKVAITGGTGFIGRHLIARHVAMGDQVRYLTRRQQAPALSGAQPCHGDLADMAVLREFVRDVDVIYHCAAELQAVQSMEATNVQGTANLLAAAACGSARWVQLSSTGVYGPVRIGTVTETSAIAPVNEYERSKAKADALVQAAARANKLSCVILRPSNVYGSDMSNPSLFQLMRMMDKGWYVRIGGADAMANYIHVENVVEALVLAGQVILPQNGREYIVSDHCSWGEFGDMLASHLGQKRSAANVPEFLARVLVALVGWVPGFPLTRSRIDAMTGRAIYATERIETELGYRHVLGMDAGVAELVRGSKHAG